jgi:phosphonopyruvate decarboxylase
MLDCTRFLSALKSRGIRFSAGVPDSLLKNICAAIADSGTDIITSNEGAAVALATGHHLATGEIPFVYMQNSGFGNAINPLTSLTDPEVYAIPVLLMVGWRGEPGFKDEPQHVKMGRVNPALLDALEIPFEVLSKDPEFAEDQLDRAFSMMRSTSGPFVLLVQADTFAPYTSTTLKTVPAYGWKREDAVRELLAALPEVATVVSTTGKTSREVYETRISRKEPAGRDFLTVGCMGHASQIAAGIALAKPELQVVCIDGDGAFLMHMGSAAITAALKPKNLLHVVINNGSHDSVGGQPTVGFEVPLDRIAAACGYAAVFRADSAAELKKILSEALQRSGPVFLEIRTDGGARANLGRPKSTPVENKTVFMQRLSAL